MLKLRPRRVTGTQLGSALRQVHPKPVKPRGLLRRLGRKAAVLFVMLAGVGGLALGTQSAQAGPIDDFGYTIINLCDPNAVNSTTQGNDVLSIIYGQTGQKSSQGNATYNPDPVNAYDIMDDYQAWAFNSFSQGENRGNPYANTPPNIAANSAFLAGDDVSRITVLNRAITALYSQKVQTAAEYNGGVPAAVAHPTYNRYGFSNLTWSNYGSSCWNVGHWLSPIADLLYWLLVQIPTLVTFGLISLALDNALYGAFYNILSPVTSVLGGVLTPWVVIAAIAVGLPLVYIKTRGSAHRTVAAVAWVGMMVALMTLFSSNMKGVSDFAGNAVTNVVGSVACSVTNTTNGGSTVVNVNNNGTNPSQAANNIISGTGGAYTNSNGVCGQALDSIKNAIYQGVPLQTWAAGQVGEQQRQIDVLTEQAGGVGFYQAWLNSWYVGVDSPGQIRRGFETFWNNRNYESHDDNSKAGAWTTGAIDQKGGKPNAVWARVPALGLIKMACFDRSNGRDNGGDEATGIGFDDDADTLGSDEQARGKTPQSINRWAVNDGGQILCDSSANPGIKASMMDGSMIFTRVSLALTGGLTALAIMLIAAGIAIYIAFQKIIWGFLLLLSPIFLGIAAFGDDRRRGFAKKYGEVLVANLLKQAGAVIALILVTQIITALLFPAAGGVQLPWGLKPVIVILFFFALIALFPLFKKIVVGAARGDTSVVEGAAGRAGLALAGATAATVAGGAALTGAGRKAMGRGLEMARGVAGNEQFQDGLRSAAYMGSKKARAASRLLNGVEMIGGIQEKLRNRKLAPAEREEALQEATLQHAALNPDRYERDENGFLTAAGMGEARAAVEKKLERPENPLSALERFAQENDELSEEAALVARTNQLMEQDRVGRYAGPRGRELAAQDAALEKRYLAALTVSERQKLNDIKDKPAELLDATGRPNGEAINAAATINAEDQYERNVEALAGILQTDPALGRKYRNIAASGGEELAQQVALSDARAELLRGNDPTTYGYVQESDGSWVKPTWVDGHLDAVDSGIPAWGGGTLAVSDVIPGAALAAGSDSQIAAMQARADIVPNYNAIKAPGPRRLGQALQKAHAAQREMVEGGNYQAAAALADYAAALESGAEPSRLVALADTANAELQAAGSETVVAAPFTTEETAVARTAAQLTSATSAMVSASRLGDPTNPVYAGNVSFQSAARAYEDALANNLSDLNSPTARAEIERTHQALINHPDLRPENQGWTAFEPGKYLAGVSDLDAQNEVDSVLEVLQSRQEAGTGHNMVGPVNANNLAPVITYLEAVRDEGRTSSAASQAYASMATVYGTQLNDVREAISGNTAVAFTMPTVVPGTSVVNPPSVAVPSTQMAPPTPPAYQQPEATSAAPRSATGVAAPSAPATANVVVPQPGPDSGDTPEPVAPPQASTSAWRVPPAPAAPQTSTPPPPSAVWVVPAVSGEEPRSEPPLRDRTAHAESLTTAAEPPTSSGWVTSPATPAPSVLSTPAPAETAGDLVSQTLAATRAKIAERAAREAAAKQAANQTPEGTPENDLPTQEIVTGVEGEGPAPKPRSTGLLDEVDDEEPDF